MALKQLESGPRYATEPNGCDACDAWADLCRQPQPVRAMRVGRDKSGVSQCECERLELRKINR